MNWTGYPGHDEAFFKINGEKYSLLAMVDSNNQRIINNQIVLEDEYRDLMEAFIYILTKEFISIPRPKHTQSTPPITSPRFKKAYINWRWISRVSSNC